MTDKPKAANVSSLLAKLMASRQEVQIKNTHSVWYMNDGVLGRQAAYHGPYNKCMVVVRQNWARVQRQGYDLAIMDNSTGRLTSFVLDATRGANVSNKDQWKLMVQRLQPHATLNPDGQYIWACVSGCTVGRWDVLASRGWVSET